MHNISFITAFIAGLLSFVSPCVLPLIPAYLGFIAGVSLSDADQIKVRKLTFVHSCFFILGFSIIFILFGASASLVGKLLLTYRELLRQVSGVIVIFFGLYIMGIIKVPFLDLERKIQLKEKPAGFMGSIIMGMAFAIGWTPCVGPILGSILLLAGTSSTVLQGSLLLAIYSLGLGIPFLLISLTLNSFVIYFEKIKKYLWIINFVSGILLVALGLSLIGKW